MRGLTITGLALLTLAGLGACGEGGSAVETRDRIAGPPEIALTSTDAPEASPATSGQVAGPAVITANRRETVDDKILRLYARNGADFGARSPEEFLAKVTTFTTRPPSGTETVSRPNGDTLMYETKSNTFAVVARDGTPRTMFKPTDGAAYWAEQKLAAPTFGQRQPG